MAEIAREAEVSVGAMYLHFTSKDAILEALARRRYDEVLAAMQHAAGDRTQPYPDRLRAVLDAKVQRFLALADEGPNAFEIIHCGRGCVQSAHERFRSAELLVIADLLAEARREGALAFEGEAHALAEVILMAYATFAPPWVFHLHKASVQRKLDALHTLTLCGLLPRSHQPLTDH